MSEIAVVPTSLKTSKRDIRKTIQEKLTLTLADYRSVVGEKKFDNRIRKAARRLGQDIVSALPRKQKKKSKVAETEEKAS